MDTTRRYLTIPDLARLCHRSRRTIHRWLTAGLVPSFRLGGTRFVDERDLDALVERAKQASAQP